MAWNLGPIIPIKVILKKTELLDNSNDNCIHHIASGGYYGFCFVTLPSQCVERFHCCCSNEKNIIARLVKFVGYIHNHKILPGNSFGLILKNTMAAMGIFSTFSKEFCWPSRTKGIIARDLKFAGHLHHYKILTWNIFGLIFASRWLPQAFLCQSWKVLISPLLLILEVCEANL